MANTTGLPVLFSAGNHAGRPAASAVGSGGLYACSTHSLIYQSDGVSSWATWATLGTSGAIVDPMTTRGDVIVRNSSNVTARLAVGAAGKILTSDGTDAAWGNGPMTTAGDIIIGGASGTPTRLAAGSTSGHVLTSNGSGVAPSYQAAGGGGGGGANADHPLPLDSYAIDATYGDDFASSSLSGIWTRRNFTSGAETRQLGKAGTWMRIAMTGRAVGDGYYQTAPAGDWTFAMATIMRRWTVNSWGIAVINSSGTGISLGFGDPGGGTAAQLLMGLTTYTTYAASFQNSTPDVWFNTVNNFNHRKFWQYLRKSGTNYYAAYSFDGEMWSEETPAFSSGITVDRVGMIPSPLTGITTTALIDIDWFNKIA